MAVASIQTKSDFSFQIEKQSAWNTAPDSASKLLLTENMDFAMDPNAHNVPIARGIRGPHESDNWNDLIGVIPTASFSWYATPNMMSTMIPAMCQFSGLYSATASVWTEYARDTCVDFPNPKSDNFGYYYVLTRRACQALKSSYIKNAVPTNYTFKISNVDNDQMLICDSEWIGQGYTRAMTPAATVTTQTLSGLAYSFANIGAFSWGAYDLTTDLKSVEISMSNGASYVDDIPTGPLVFKGWDTSVTFTVAAGTNTEAMKVLCEASDADDARMLTLQFGAQATTPVAKGLIIRSFNCLTKFTEDFENGETVTLKHAEFSELYLIRMRTRLVLFGTI
jgi:hypothetical protein